jgi:hypothetical protein
MDINTLSLAASTETQKDKHLYLNACFHVRVRETWQIREADYKAGS